MIYHPLVAQNMTRRPTRLIAVGFMIAALVLAAMSFAQPEAGAQDDPSYPSSPVYQCPPDLGYVTSGSGVDTTCTRVTPAVAVGDGTYLCPAEFKSAGTGVSKTCTLVVVFTDTVPVATTSTYRCPAGYLIEGSGASAVCTRRVIGDEVTASIANADGTYRCPPEFAPSGSEAMIDAATVCIRVGPLFETTSTIATPNGTVAGCPSAEWLSVGQDTGKYCIRPLTAAEINARYPSQPATTVPVPAPTPAPATPAPAPAVVAAPVAAVVAAPSVVTASDFGFGSSLPATHAAATTPVLAHTGANSELLAYAALAFVASGAVLLGSRRQYL